MGVLRNITEALSLSSVLPGGPIGTLLPSLIPSLPPSFSPSSVVEIPGFPDFLPSNTTDQFPWGNRTAKIDPHADIPSTGITRYYNLTVSRGVLAPDGFEKSGIYINGQFPGPAIEANWGDMLEVTVHNQISGPSEGTSMHWHGLSQNGTQWSDGVPGVSQCPIAPGNSFTYRFRADVYGTSWYHSHFSAQYTAGAFGPMIIYGPKHVPYDIDIGPVVLGDYYHRDYFSVIEDVAGTNPDFKVFVPSSDNTLINGKNNYNCSMAPANSTCFPNAGLAKFNFQSGKTHRLRLINAGAAALLHFSIDGHAMQVIANDFTPLIPYEADVITLHSGQRTDVLVTAPEEPLDAYWMRSTISLNCSVSTTTNALAVVLYDDASEFTLPKTEKSAAAAVADRKDVLCQNDPLHMTVPWAPIPIDPEPDITVTVEVDLVTNATGSHIWTINNRTQYTDYNDPVLMLANQGNFSYPDPEWMVWNMGKSKTVRIVMNTVYQSPHPMHLHGHSFAVLSAGQGPWDGKTIINPTNPVRRDIHTLPRYGHLVIQFTADNPGIWSYHCHIAWHSATGYTMQIVERPGEFYNPELPGIMDQTCKAWDKYTQGHKVDQIDSGI
ncbi:multicopper oxidase [Xylona heveae TC161]|uniref:Multicopper oxidase n=1 Tax=Xylona heveae (strain CBS 132557 / TC161) TaxID=1328760 RepID=A0A165AAR4_XYLHT|nr:multicopper oxidase [Xylona heveae TC161]KZF20183.1 multicopper oxidase [Xylona heveae TC161]